MGRPRKGWVLRDPKPGRTLYTVRFTDKAGAQKEFTTGESDAGKASIRAAEIYAADLVSAPVAGPRVDPHLKLQVHYSSWLASLKSTHDELSVRTYVIHGRYFLDFFGDSLSRINTASMANYSRKRLGEVLRVTLLKERSTMNGFLGWCVEQGVLAEAHMPKWPRLPKKALGTRSGTQREFPVDVTSAQVNAFLAELPLWSRARQCEEAFAVRARFIVAYETGLRPALLDALEMPKHWRPGSMEIVIEKQHDKARFGRKVPISARCAEALERTVLALSLKSGLIFGKHSYRHWVDRAARAAGLPEDFAPYDLRHGRAGHLLDAGGAMRAVAHLLGHKKLTTTDRYLRAQEGDARAALDAARSRGVAGDSDGNEAGAGPKEDVNMRDDSVHGEGVKPSRLSTVEPETSEALMLSHTYDANVGQEGTQKDTIGQDSRDIPETFLPDSVVAAAGYLAILQATEEAFERLILEDIKAGDDEGPVSR